MANSFLDKAVEIVKQAIQKDNEEQYQEALTLYTQSLEYFMKGLKYENNPTTKEIVKQRVAGYIERAEELKKVISNPRKKATVAAGGGKKKGHDDEEDNESAKMSNALSSAIVSEKPNVKWDDVAGLEKAKDALKEAVILPARFPQLFTGKRRPWKGILLYGPPGTGKSYLAKAVATEADSTFFAVSSSDLVSKWQGESEKLVKTLFDMARAKKPAIIFIDEIDSLCGSRTAGENDSARRIKTEFLVQMQGVGTDDSGLLVLGATNVPWEIDAAMRRRFEKRVYIPLPDDVSRGTMFKIHTSGDSGCSLTESDYTQLGLNSPGYSGSDVYNVVKGALMEPLRECRSARFFFLEESSGLYSPSENDPPCMYCHPKLSTCKEGCKKCLDQCSKCGAFRMTLYDIPGDKLKVPALTMKHFVKALENSTPTVDAKELKRFEDWTLEFGSEGSW